MLNRIIFYIKNQDELDQEAVNNLSLQMKNYLERFKNKIDQNSYVLKYIFTDQDLESLDEKFVHQQNVFIDGFFGNEDLDFVHMSQEFSTDFVVVNLNEETRLSLIKFGINNYHTLNV